MSRRFPRHACLPLMILLAFLAFPAQAEHAGIYRIVKIDPGVKVLRANNKSEPAGNEVTLSGTDRLCFEKSPTQLSIQDMADKHRILDLLEPATGCTLVRDIIHAGQKALPDILRDFWRTFFPEKQILQTSGATRGTPTAISAFCNAPADTDWWVLDSLADLVIPVTMNRKVSASLQTLGSAGNASAQTLPALEDGKDKLHLPALGQPGQRYQLALSAQDLPPCTLHLRIVDAREYPAIVPPRARESAEDAAFRAAVHGLRVVSLEGHAWRLEALRQLEKLPQAPDKLPTDVLKAKGYLARPDELCANTDTDHPVAFAMPMLRAEKSWLLEGTRSLYLAWIGGLPPFRVLLVRPGEQTPLAEISVGRQCEATLPPVRLVPGTYQLHVIDEKGIPCIEENLEVVPSKQQALPPSGSLLEQAQWLAEQEKGLWRFEAIQQVATQRSSNPKAQAWIFRNVTLPKEQ